MRAVFTGATGFLGRQILAHTKDSGVERVALVRDGSAWPYAASEVGPLERVTGGLTAGEWVDNLGHADVIVHMAGHVHHSRDDAEDAYRVNVDGTLEMVRAAEQLEARLVFVSTSGVVGCFRDAERRADEDAPYVETTIRNWPYYHSKLRAEQEASALAERCGVELVIVRPPMLYGPGDHRFRTSSTAIKVLRRKFPARIPGGVAFTDIRDVAAALWKAATIPEPKPVYHLPGTEWSVSRLFAEIAALGGVAPPRFEIPYRVAHSLAVATKPVSRWTRKNWMPDPVVVEMGAHHWGLASKYAEADLGFAPRPPEQTLRDMVSWLSDHHPDLSGTP